MGRGQCGRTLPGGNFLNPFLLFCTGLWNTSLELGVRGMGSRSKGEQAFHCEKLRGSGSGGEGRCESPKAMIRIQPHKHSSEKRQDSPIPALEAGKEALQRR